MHVQTLARIVAKNLGINVVYSNNISTFQIAKLDDGTMQIALAKQVLDVYEGREELVAAVTRGAIAHEALGHGFHTDFSVAANTQYGHSLANALEDVRIERLAPEQYPGARQSLKELVHYLVTENGFLAPRPNPILEEALVLGLLRKFRVEILGQDVPADVTNELLEQCRAAMGDATFGKIERLARGACMSSSTKDVIQAADEIVEILKNAKQQPPPPPPPPKPQQSEKEKEKPKDKPSSQDKGGTGEKDPNDADKGHGDQDKANPDQETDPGDASEGNQQPGDEQESGSEGDGTAGDGNAPGDQDGAPEDAQSGKGQTGGGAGDDPSDGASQPGGDTGGQPSDGADQAGDLGGQPEGANAPGDTTPGKGGPGQQPADKCGAGPGSGEGEPLDFSDRISIETDLHEATRQLIEATTETVPMLDAEAIDISAAVRTMAPLKFDATVMPIIQRMKAGLTEALRATTEDEDDSEAERGRLDCSKLARAAAGLERHPFLEDGAPGQGLSTELLVFFDDSGSMDRLGVAYLRDLVFAVGSTLASFAPDVRFNLAFYTNTSRLVHTADKHWTPEHGSRVAGAYRAVGGTNWAQSVMPQIPLLAASRKRRRVMLTVCDDDVNFDRYPSVLRELKERRIETSFVMIGHPVPTGLKGVSCEQNGVAFAKAFGKAILDAISPEFV